MGVVRRKAPPILLGDMRLPLIYACIVASMDWFKAITNEELDRRMDQLYVDLFMTRWKWK